MLPARSLLRNAAAGAMDRVVLSYDERFLRRKRLTCESGASFMVDLAETISVEDGDAFVLDDGRKVAVVAAEEPVVRVEGHLPRLAWHIGNRHTPCQVAEGHLVIRRDPVIEAMLKGLGATLTLHIAPFRPEGGAYGHGRTMGHDHGPAGHFALNFGATHG
ncbi:urease accessory protein UreE [Cypionkella sinensis]|uniref:Urease accessory protein UreE n=1 Tax=Cypionkella sinensis TaxID=1756043 RepID=A0ABV7J618_9RHOB